MDEQVSEDGNMCLVQIELERVALALVHSDVSAVINEPHPTISNAHACVDCFPCLLASSSKTSPDWTKSVILLEESISSCMTPYVAGVVHSHTH